MLSNKLNSLILLALCVIVAIAGCGGAGGGSGTPSAAKGLASVKVLWPKVTTKLIPNKATVIQVDVTQGGTTNTQYAVRPSGDSSSGPSTSALSFLDLSEGTWKVVATAYATFTGSMPNPTPTGNPVAQSPTSGVSQASFVVVGGQTTNFTATMFSTVKAFKVTIGSTVKNVVPDAVPGTGVAGNTITVPFGTDVSIAAVPDDGNSANVVLVQTATGNEISTTGAGGVSVSSSSTSSSTSITTTVVHTNTAGAGSVSFVYRESGATFTLPLTILPFQASTLVTDTVSHTVDDVTVGRNLDADILVAYEQGNVRTTPVDPTSGAIAGGGSVVDIGITPAGRIGDGFYAKNSGVTFGATGDTARTLGGTAPSIYDMAVYKGSNATLLDTAWLLFTESAATQARKFDSTGVLASAIAIAGNPTPIAFGVGNNHASVGTPLFYLVDSSNNVHRYDSAGVADATFATNMAAASPALTALDVDTDDTLVYVLDGGTNKVRVFLYTGIEVTAAAITLPSTGTRLAVGARTGGAARLLVGYAGGIMMYKAPTP